MADLLFVISVMFSGNLFGALHRFSASQGLVQSLSCDHLPILVKMAKSPDPGPGVSVRRVRFAFRWWSYVDTQTNGSLMDGEREAEKEKGVPRKGKERKE